jgi:preprotein translocase subunit SecG
VFLAIITNIYLFKFILMVVVVVVVVILVKRGRLGGISEMLKSVSVKDMCKNYVYRFR